MGQGGVGGEGDRRDDGKVKLGSGNAAVVGGQRHGRELLRGRVRPAGGLVESEGRSIGPLAGHLLWAPPPREWRPVPRPTWEEWYEGDKRKGGGGGGGARRRRQARPQSRLRECHRGTTRSRPPAAPPSAKARIAQNAPAPPRRGGRIPLLLLRSRRGRIECTSRIGGKGRACGRVAGEQRGVARRRWQGSGRARPWRRRRVGGAGRLSAHRGPRGGWCLTDAQFAAAAKSEQDGGGAGAGEVVEWWR